MSQTATTKTESGKVIPDEGTLDGDFELTANDKVQLDIDDAPFLLDPDEEEAPPPVLSAERSLITRETTETGKGKKKADCRHHHSCAGDSWHRNGDRTLCAEEKYFRRP